MSSADPIRDFIEAEEKELSEIILQHDRQFFIPLNQRPWAWSEAKDVQRFLDDFYKTLSAFYDPSSAPKWKPQPTSKLPPHFFGTLVFFDRTKKHLEVFDGQQRITALTMLCALLREAAQELASKDARHSTLVGAFNEWLQVSATGSSRRLIPNKFYRPLFDALIYEPHSETERKKLLSALDPALAAHSVSKKLIKSFEHIRSWLNEQTSSLSDEEIAHFLTGASETLRRHFCCIETVIHDEQYAFQVFGCLNARGEKLSEADKIKNDLFLSAPQSDRPHISDVWTRIGENILEQDIGEFLRRRYIALHGACKKNEVHDVLLRKEIDPSTSTKKLVDDWKVDSDLYHNIVTRKSGFANKETLVRLEIILDVLRVGLAQVPLIAAAKALLPKNKTEFEKCVRALECFVFRTRTIQKTDTSELERLLGEAARRIKSSGDVSSFISYLKSKCNDAEFEEAFATHTDNRANVQYYILREIETELLGKGGAGVIPGDHHQAKNHVEHVLPKTLSKDASRLMEWSWFRAHPDKHKSLVNRIGNLMILESQINKTVGNHSFEVKRGAPYKGSKSGASAPLKTCYKDSDLKLPHDLCNKAKWKSWTEENIDKRQSQMAKLAVKIWEVK